MKIPIKIFITAAVMKFAAAILLGLLAVSAVQGRQVNPWEKKAHDLEVKFEKLVDHKATQLISKVKSVVGNTKEEVKDFVMELESEINATVAYAIKEIEALKLDVSLQCFENASRDIYEAQEAAIANLLGCQNLSIAYQDIQEIAQNASAVVLDIVADARLIIEGVAECSIDVGVAKFQCVLKYVTQEIKNLISQWPDAKRFINVVKTLGRDVEYQVNTCIRNPTQQSLDEQVEKALSEFSACSQQSWARFA